CARDESNYLARFDVW
nr:immunoglobulin heavy chain junction region [Macaca mulatta]MOV50694.1 immunoglobulin heavy chain junction region [Macaca mulatta]MOV50704.1 immunoglobulin heavy chain junction region [Macaca mulatta]MOV50752.1 immunoglobulin heavy chain junction region [Macaca mulatta]MOV50937.1 immunoglobulin heavy chain junction region [Macaca mulatta]